MIILQKAGGRCEPVADLILSTPEPPRENSPLGERSEVGPKTVISCSVAIGMTMIPTG